MACQCQLRDFNLLRFCIYFLIWSVMLERTLADDVPEFQYPCYVDICTFPTQFCNSDKYERRCSPCSRAICRAPNVPLACRYICMKHNELTTTKKPTTTTTMAPSHYIQSIGTESFTSLHLIMAYSAIATTLLVVVLLGFIAYYIHRKKDSKERNTQVPKNTPARGDGERENIEENERLVNICSACARPCRETLNIPNMSLPSYTSGCNDANDQRGGFQTGSSDSSIENVNYSSGNTGSSKTRYHSNRKKEQKVKPMTKINNLTETPLLQKTKTSVGVETEINVDSLLASRDECDAEETSLKST